VSEDGNAFGRPVGVAIDKSGAQLVADDVGPYGVARRGGEKMNVASRRKSYAHRSLSRPGGQTCFTML
jgi:glucose/arabinose dehydrogenase